MRVRFLFLLAGLLPAIPLETCMAAERPLGVCQALRSVRVHRGKMVEIRGVLVRGRHGWSLGDQSHRRDRQCPGLERKDWLPWISVASPVAAEDDPPVAFEQDREAIRATLDRFDKYPHPKPVLLVTVVGELRARPDIVIRRQRENDTLFGNGYGQMGMYAAQLVVRTMRDASMWPEQ